MMTAIAGGIPDRVPVAPDISNMIPARRTGKPFMHVYAENDPPLWRAYIDAVKYFGFDAWFIYGGAHLSLAHPTCEYASRWLEQTDERWIQETTVRTPKGDLRSVTIFPHDKPPATLERWVKHPAEDLPKLYEMWAFDTVDTTQAATMRAELGELGAFGMGIATPGFHFWETFVEGSVQSLSYLLMDTPELLDELRERHHEHLMREFAHLLAFKPDFILTGGSGSVTMASPTLWRQYALPTLQAQTKLAREAGVLTMVHSCGKERYMVEVCANETELDCINPLEIAPMGDCDLREIKQAFGHKIALMGNLHTTDLMLRGSVAEVKAAARQAIDDAAEGGGFILSTGDQCGRDTPDENIFALVEVAETYGRYPLSSTAAT
jgi:hypothetical protein